MQPAEPPTRRYQFDIFADYHQVYLDDCQLHEQRAQGLLEHPPESPEQFAARMKRLEEDADRIVSLLAPESRARHLGVAHGTLCILTARYLTVPVTIEVREMPVPGPEDWTGWDFVVEASLEVPSGCVVVYGPTDSSADAPRIMLAPGTYRARIHYGGIATVSDDQLDGEDHYLIVLWPAPAAPPNVLHAGVHGRW